MATRSMLVQVHLLPSLVPGGALRGGVAVVVDILRATTAMIHALDSGITMIRPCVDVQQALDLADALGRPRTLLGGERQGVLIPGFQLGNSPTSYTPDVCKDKILVITTTNGTRAIHASLEADRVLVGSFANLGATLRQIDLSCESVHVICAGTNGRVSLEDSLFAGAFIAGLRSRIASENGNVRVVLEDEGVIAERAWYQAEFSDRDPQARARLASLLSLGRGGQRVHELGYDRDIVASADLDRFDLAAELERDPVRIVRV